nr:hypothetical protein [Tanacetum cinerariifolium]
RRLCCEKGSQTTGRIGSLEFQGTMANSAGKKTKQRKVEGLSCFVVWRQRGHATIYGCIRMHTSKMEATKKTMGDPTGIWKPIAVLSVQLSTPVPAADGTVATSGSELKS